MSRVDGTNDDRAVAKRGAADRRADRSADGSGGDVRAADIRTGDVGPAKALPADGRPIDVRPDDQGAAGALLGDGLAAGLDRVWALLAAAVGDSRAPLRTPVVATGGAEGSPTDARVMVLRAADRERATLTFFTDARAAKVAAIAAAPGVTVAGYDPVGRCQLRLAGSATVAREGTAVDTAWASVPPPARRAYRTLAAPGTPLPSSTPAALREDDGRETFAVLTVTITAIDVLDLATPGHRRSAYRRDGAGWHAAWCVP